MKIDNMANIQLNTVHGKKHTSHSLFLSFHFFSFFINNNIGIRTVGREPLRNVDEVTDLHKGRHISPDYLRNNMFQLSDLFSIPQATLLSDVVQYFRDNNMRYR
jgi:hypothetical protein